MSTFTPQQIRQWRRYEEIRLSGVCNMLELPTRFPNEFSREDIKFIIENYDALKANERKSPTAERLEMNSKDVIDAVKAATAHLACKMAALAAVIANPKASNCERTIADLEAKRAKVVLALAEASVEYAQVDTAYQNAVAGVEGVHPKPA
jgi:hypothetical protein